MLSIMSGNLIDVKISTHDRLAELGRRVLSGEQIDYVEATWLFGLESSSDIFDLMSWANRIREHFKGNKIHLCSIVNAKAGACSENCSFCAQSSFHQTGSPRYGFVDPEPVIEAAEEAHQHGV
ncbi:MAG TPA: biotin synthase BioB, partial [Verrucomicrobiae bacterium]|nr:biotin synthase BioB [Verrucomicrobiae bacterium]